MTRICWRLVDLVSRMLDPDERDAVRGDFAESGETGGRALRELLGLVIRRQAALWTDWRPWLGLVGLVAPLGLLLSVVSGWWAYRSAVSLWLYSSWWDSAFLWHPLYRDDLIETIVDFFLRSLTLIGWSWTSGFVLGALSRRATWVNGALCCLLVFVVTLAGPPDQSGNSMIFSLAFYRVVFPLMLGMILVVFPLLRGMRRSLRRASLPLLPTLLWAALMTMLTTWTGGGLEYSLIFGHHVMLPVPGLDGVLGTADDPRPLRLLPLVMMWPMAYMVATAGWQRWRNRLVSK